MGLWRESRVHSLEVRPNATQGHLPVGGATRKKVYRVDGDRCFYLIRRPALPPAAAAPASA